MIAGTLVVNKDADLSRVVSEYASTKTNWVAIVGISLIVSFITIIFISTFAAIVLVSLTGTQQSARDAQRKAHLVNVYRNGLDNYFKSQNEFPVSNPGGDSTYPVATGIFNSSGPLMKGGYVSIVPTDPNNGISSCKIANSAGSQTCAYKYLGTKDKYVIWVILETPSTAGGVYLARSTGDTETTDKEPTSP